MVTSNLIDGKPYFSSQVNHIEISNDLNPKGGVVKIYIAGELAIRELYYKINQMIHIYDAGTLINNYVKLPPIGVLSDTYQISPVTSKICFAHLGMDIPVSTNNVYYTRCAVDMDKDSSMFFTERTKIRTKPGRPEFLSFLFKPSIKISIGVAFMSGRQAMYKRVNLPLPSGLTKELVSVSVSLDRIASLSAIPVNDVMFYDVMLEGTSGITDKLRYQVDERAYKDEITFVYYNAFGIPSSFTCTGLTEYTPELGGNITALLDTVQRPNARMEDVRTINTGYLSETDYREFVTLTTSPELYLYQDGNLLPIVIDDLDFTHKKLQNEKMNVQLTIRQTRKIQCEFSRKPAIKKRVFDKSFDISFE